MTNPTSRLDAPPPGNGVRVHADGPVRIVTLDRPESSNAVSRSMHAELASLWNGIRADPDARVVVLTGAGQHFSAGGDLEMIEAVSEDSTLRKALMGEARDIILEMLNFPLPVIAAVNGAAVGLGCSLAMLCDVVLMADDAYLSDPHVAIGLVAGDGGAALWPILASPLKVKELLFTGARIGAMEAEQIGMATRVVPGDQLMAEAMRVARRLAELPPQAVQDTKRAVNLHLSRAASGVIEFALAAETISMTEPEHRARVRAMAGRTSPGPARRPTAETAASSAASGA